MHNQQQPRLPSVPPPSSPPAAGSDGGQPANKGGYQLSSPRNRLVIAAVAFASLVAFGAGVGIGTVASLFRPAAAPRACVESIERANDLIAQIAGTITLSQQATEAAAAQDVETLEAIGRQVDARTPEVRAARTAFDSAAEECKSVQ
jgi:hypothetical protein